MQPPHLWNSILLLILGALVIYTTAKVITTGGNLNTIPWNQLNDYPQPECIYPYFYALPYTFPKYIACMIFTSFERLRRFTVACVDIAIFETMGILPSLAWGLLPLSNEANYHIWSPRSSTFEPQNHECSNLTSLDEQQACLSKFAKHSLISVIVASIVVGLACVGFGALITKYIRRYNAVALKEKKSPVNMVGLGRDLGSDITDVRSTSTKSEPKKDEERGVEEDGDEMVASTWKVPISRQNSSAWKRFLHSGHRASVKSTENRYLAPPTSQIPPRIPTPQLPSAAIFLSDSARARMGLQRKPLNGLAAFQDDVFVVRSGLVVPEIRVTSAGSY